MQPFGKRQKELARLEHRKQKEAKRAERKRLKEEAPARKEGDPDPSIEYPPDYTGPRETLPTLPTDPPAGDA